MTTMPTDHTIDGTALDDGGVRLDGEGNGEWMEAEYREGWVGRKLVGTHKDEYDAMVHPYLYKCTWCREWHDVTMWPAGSNLCPHCEQAREYTIGPWFEATEDGDLPRPTECCPRCGSTDIEIGVIADFDSVCHDCDHTWTDTAVPEASDE